MPKAESASNYRFKEDASAKWHVKMLNCGKLKVVAFSNSEINFNWNHVVPLYISVTITKLFELPLYQLCILNCNVTSFSNTS
jgi:hypothetical protein